MSGVVILGSIAALFAAALLTLPTVRVVQGRLGLRGAAGLWIAGCGFLVLTAAAFVLDGPAVTLAIWIGMGLAVTGNVIQRWASEKSSDSN